MAYAAVSQAAISANCCAFFCSRFPTNFHCKVRLLRFYRAAASSDDADCNTEECAPDKEVGKVSMDWLAEERSKVVGTFPPRNRSWTGYVQKDTAGQTNIYSVEPSPYVAESVISSGTAGSSSDGSENTTAIALGIALIFIAGASSILLQLGKTQAQMQTPSPYSGPSLSYYIYKFKSSPPIDTLLPGTLPTDGSSTLLSGS